MRVLLTGFEPFEGAPTNSTELVVRHIERLSRDGGSHPAFAHEIRTVILPVADRTAGPAMHEALDRHEPKLIVALGEAAARTSVGIERVAINLRDYRIPDNEGVVVSEQPIVPGGPAGYFATLPLPTMLEAFGRRSIPARLSRDAGTFLCNQVMYELLHRLAGAGASEPEGPPAGFIHIPLVAEQIPEVAAGQRRMPKPGAGVFDALASDGSPIEAAATHWHQTLGGTAVDTETMALGVLDAIIVACERECERS